MDTQNTTETKGPPPKAPPMFLMGLDVHSTNLVLGAAKKQQAPANQIILNSGEKATRLYLMRRGRVRYYKPTRSGEEVLLTWLTPGDVFGLGTLLTNPPDYIGTAETITDSEMFMWEHMQIRKLARAYPQLAENSFRIILKYLQSFSEKHVSLITNTAEERLGQVMLDLAHRIGNVSPDGVEINATNEQLSALANISSFTTSRLLNRWSRSGVVSKGRQKVWLHTPEALAFA